jgi:mono/diheme cytochrome c family protein
VGRQPTDPLNTTGQLMPAKGGNPALTDEDLYNVVAYIRSLNGATVGGGTSAPTETPSGPTPTPTEFRRPANASNWTPPVLPGSGAAEATPAAEATAAAEATTEPAATPVAESTAAAVAVSAEGQDLYARYCASCHGAAGEGVGGQAALAGVTWDPEAFVQEITVPAPVGTIPTGFVHPFRGGFPTLTDEQIQAVVAYTLSLGQ